MSKSKNNGVDPQDMVDRYGADTVRLFTMFASPPDHTLEWNDAAVAGSLRFLRRLWALVYRHQSCLSGTNDLNQTLEWDAETREMRRLVHTVLQRINRDMARNQFNTVIAASMELFNGLDHFEPGEDPARQFALREAMDILIRVLSPVVPHIAHSLWQLMNSGVELLDASWPEVDVAALQTSSCKLAVQVNGKLRGQIEVAIDADELQIREQVLANEKIGRHIGESKIKRFIVVPQKLVNVVI